MKLTPAMLRSLRAFEQPWVSAWWGGKPMGRYPRGVGPKSFDALLSRKLIQSQNIGRLDRMISITDAGRRAMLSANGGEDA